jgi:acetylornithine deacetylase
MMDEAAAIDELPALALARRDQARSIAALADLVRIRSLTGEEGPAQDHVASLLAAIGAEVTRFEPDIAALFQRFPHIAQYPTHWRHDLILPYDELPTHEALLASGLADVLSYRGRPNVVGVLRGSGGGRSLMLATHIDTVTVEPIAEWTRDPFGAEVADGRMHGRGTSDMKGGLMAGLMALAFLREAGLRLRGDVIFACVVNEEHAGNGTLDLVRRGVTADAAIVLEPTNNTVFVTNPGGLYWELKVPGVSRSPGARWDENGQAGVSAIERLPSVVGALLALENEINAKSGSGKPFSLVMGRIAGGHYETVTASEVTLRGSAYFAPSAGDVGEIMELFRAAIAKANAADPFLAANPAHIRFLHHDDSASQPRDIAIARHAAAVLGSRGADASVGDAPFCCDMRHLVNQGAIPSIIFGPGTIAQAHKPDEHISLAEYTACIEHLIVMIARWCNSPRA